MNVIAGWFLMAAFAQEEGVRPDIRGIEAVPSPAADLVAPYGEVHALVIGIDSYADAGVPRLANAVQDARSIADLLQRRFRFESVVLLTDDRATRSGILNQLGQYQRLTSDDALFIFWAGHGLSLPTPTGEMVGFLVPHDGTMDKLTAVGANIPMTQLRDAVGSVIPAKHKFLVVDTCFSGVLAMRDAPPVPTRSSAYVQQATASPTFQVLTAGRGDQTVLDGGPDGHSVFTGRLLQALGAASDFVSAQELAAQVTRQVSEDARSRGHVQTPMYGALAGFGEGDFLFLSVPEDPPPEFTQAMSTLARAAESCAGPLGPWAAELHGLGTRAAADMDPVGMGEVVSLTQGVVALGGGCVR